jgi:hypothetical protein
LASAALFVLKVRVNFSCSMTLANSTSIPQLDRKLSFSRHLKMFSIMSRKILQKIVYWNYFTELFKVGYKYTIDYFIIFVNR